jgi:uncharacterized Rmd1/YagE family protein
MGPPQRKYQQREQEAVSGRVSVYCVGGEIDLSALRAHIFRRGFGAKSTPELTLSRRAPDVDEEFLHVSNAPLYLTTDGSSIVPASRSLHKDDGSNGVVNHSSKLDINSKIDELANALISQEILENHQINDKSSNSLSTFTDSELSWKTKEALLMSTQDIFYFDYGCVVCWGLSASEEKAVLTELQAFTIEPVTSDELQDSFDTMEFAFDRTVNPQKPIKFDRMKLRSLQSDEKLALSYAMAQSSKLFVLESKVLESVERTRYLPKELAREGRIFCSKKDLNRLIGQLFVEQTEVNLFSTILDTPDFLWDNDEYFSTYQYCRSYLEVDERVSLLNSRLSVIRELLDVLTAQVADSNSTRLEWIVVWLIAIEIVLGIASSPLFVGKRAAAAILVPIAILLLKRFDWSFDHQ